VGRAEGQGLTAIVLSISFVAEDSIEIHAVRVADDCARQLQIHLLGLRGLCATDSVTFMSFS
jgi:hypothetical protein